MHVRRYVCIHTKARYAHWTLNVNLSMTKVGTSVGKVIQNVVLKTARCSFQVAVIDIRQPPRFEPAARLMDGASRKGTQQTL